MNKDKSMDEKFNKSTVNGYAISAKIRKDLKEEGYVALKIVKLTSNQELLKSYEAAKIYAGNFLPKGTDTVIKKEHVRNYGPLIVIDEDFMQGSNVFTIEGT